MQIKQFKYFLVLFFALTLLFKVSGVLVVLNPSAAKIDYISSNDESNEKEEKKVEIEYFDHYFLVHPGMEFPILHSPKAVIPQNFITLSYYPEVLTPPPALRS